MPDWKQQIKKYGWDAVRIGSELAEVIVHVQSKPSVFSVLAVASRAMDTLHDIVTPDPDDYFGKWEYLRTVFPHKLLHQARLKGFVERRDSTEKESDSIWTGHVYGVELGWVLRHADYVLGPYVRNSTQEEALKVLGRLMWESVGPAIQFIARDGEDILIPDNIVETLPSQVADEIYSRAKKFHQAGYRRSILLYGESGVGKSHIMRYIAQQAGGFSLRINAHDLPELGLIGAVIELLQPNAILIDDLDRLNKPGKILSEIEEINQSAKLFLCSVNQIKKLDPAVLRASRFDEMVEITKLDDAVLDGLIGTDVPPAIEKQLRELPVAWIAEFHKRRKVFGDEEAIADIKHLQARSDLIRKLMGEDITPVQEDD